MLKEDAHISEKIVRQHYKVFKDELKDFAGLNRTYETYITQRLASHPHIPPGEPFDQLVEHNGIPHYNHTGMGRDDSQLQNIVRYSKDLYHSKLHHFLQ